MSGEMTFTQKVAKAWADVENPELDSYNPHFKNSYASLKATLGAIRKACAPVGLVYRQRLLESEAGYKLHSCIVSDGGEVEALSVFPVETPPNPQAFGSNLTYVKRQQAQADWCITGEAEDDGEAAAAYEPRGAGKPTGKRGTRPGNGSPGSTAPKAPGRFDKIAELKRQAVSMGISEDGIKSWIDAKFKKPMKDFDPAEILAVEGYIQTLIRDKQQLEEEAVDAGQ